MNKFKTKQEVESAFTALHLFLSQLHGKKYPFTKWCKDIGKGDGNASMLTNFTKKCPEESIHNASEWFARSINHFNLGCRKEENHYIFIKKEKDEAAVYSEAVDKKFEGTHLAGLYKGLFLRHEQMELAEMFLLLSHTGQAKFMTNTNKKTIYIGKFTYDKANRLLIGRFEEKQNRLYCFDFYLRVPTQYSDDSDNPIDGTYSGVLNIHSFCPTGGLIRLRLQNAWTNKSSTDEMETLFENQKPKGISLMNMNEPFPNANIDEYIDDIRFFMGYRWLDGDGTFIVNDEVIFDSVAFFKKARLIPRYDNDMSAYAGTYMVYRLATTTRTKFIGRPLLITRDGRAFLVMLNEDKSVYYYQGRAHLFEDFLAISIDRKIEFSKDKTSKPIEKTHRSLYTFEIRQMPLEDIKHVFGISNIVTKQAALRVAEEVIVKSKVDFELLKPFAHFIDSEDFSKLTDIEKKIFEYLESGHVIKVEKAPNDNFIRAKKSA